jgi:hypothetical protein
MAPTIHDFTKHPWLVSSWEPKGLPKSLVSISDVVAFTRNADSTCALGWSKEKASTDVSGLPAGLIYRDRDGDLHLAKTHILTNGHPLMEDARTKANEVDVRAALPHPGSTLYVYFSTPGKDPFVEGDLGTFTAQAQPPTEGPIHRPFPGWLRWLQRLFHG